LNPVKIIESNINEVPANTPTNTNNSNVPTTSTVNNSAVIITGIDLSKEIVTIKNTSNENVNMSGWKLISITGNQTFSFPYGFILGPSTIVKVVSGRNASGDGVSTLKWTGSYIWNNDGDPGKLVDNYGNVISVWPR